MPHSGMTPAELAKFMSRGRRKNPEDEEPIFMRLDRIVDERAILKDRHAAGHAAAQALQATIDKHETALKKWVHRAEFQKNEAPPVNKAALASPHHLSPRDWTEIHPEESSAVHKSNCRGVSPPTAESWPPRIDAMPARRRGGGGLSPIDASDSLVDLRTGRAACGSCGGKRRRTSRKL